MWEGAELAQALARGDPKARSFCALIPESLEHPRIIDYVDLFVGMAHWVKGLGYFKFILTIWELDGMNLDDMIQNGMLGSKSISI